MRRLRIINDAARLATRPTLFLPVLEECGAVAALPSTPSAAALPPSIWSAGTNCGDALAVGRAATSFAAVQLDCSTVLLAELGETTGKLLPACCSTRNSAGPMQPSVVKRRGLQTTQS